MGLATHPLGKDLRFARLTYQFDIYILRATHLVKSTTTLISPIVHQVEVKTDATLCVVLSVSLSPQPVYRQATLSHSTSCLHAASTMPRKATSSLNPKKHNFLPFKDKLELIRKCEAGIAHSVVAAQMGVPRSTVSTIWKNRDRN
ncbi:hypothetical protein E2C01_011116 [Portunus trituberculatus]|uniref:HTH psq-type domain-containing protein n=1 Tax=Portunus trituberculatus TaxID=210409 RepID=A0A5B7DAG3_PORTR|nr:hypothetical protein [Portunus trituberculatus]